MKFNIALNLDGEGDVSFPYQGGVISIPHTHPNFPRIMEELLNGNDPSQFVTTQALLIHISDRVRIEGEQVFFDDNLVDGRIAETIMRYQAEGRDASNIAKFLERLYANPSSRAREQLFNWLENQRLVIDPDGHFLAHKAVTVANSNQYPNLEEAGWNGEELYQSIHSGSASVNGVDFKGHIPNWVGATITMPRRSVDDDYKRDCSTGLHVGSFRYATGFGPEILVTKVDPADVVSVPEYDTNKLRCSKYTVVEHQENPNYDLRDYEPDATYSAESVLDALYDYGVPEDFVEQLRDHLVL